MDQKIRKRAIDSCFGHVWPKNHIKAYWFCLALFLSPINCIKCYWFYFSILWPNNNIKGHSFYPQQFSAIQPYQFSLPPSLAFLDQTNKLSFTDSISRISGWNHHFNFHYSLFNVSDQTIKGRAIDSFLQILDAIIISRLNDSVENIVGHSTVWSVTDWTLHFFQQNNHIKSQLFHPKRFSAMQPYQFLLPLSFTFLD